MGRKYISLHFATTDATLQSDMKRDQTVDSSWLVFLTEMLTILNILHARLQS